MPKRKMMSRPGGRYKKRYRRRARGRPIPRNGPLPRKLRCVHRYFVKNQTINPALGGLCDVRVYRANGMYDPEVAVGGHQPRGFDQIGSFYNRYLVIKAQITVTFTCTTSATERLVVGVAVRDIATTNADPSDYIEQGAKYKMIDAGSVSNTSKKITVTVNPNKFNGVSKPLSNSASNGTTTTDAANGVYFHVFACDNGGGDPPTLNTNVFIRYIAVWHDPRDIPIS